jgi:HEAT repeat protein
MNGRDILINGLNNIRFKGVFNLVKKVIAEEVITEEQPVAAVQLITKEDVKERLEVIRKVVKDEHPVVASAKAHVEQDKLVREVLEGIANGAEDAEGLARTVAEVFTIEFTRWYS